MSLSFLACVRVALLALLACVALPASAGQPGWQAPDRGRGGAGRVLWFGRAFPDLDVQLAAADDENHKLRVYVMLFSARDSKRHCFKAPPDLRVAFAGQPLRLLAQGRAGSPPALPGVQRQAANCSPVVFRSDDDTPVAPDMPAVVTLDRGRKHAEMTVPTFFQQRQVTVAPGSRLRPGARVALEWSPPTDEWCGADAGASVALTRAGQPPVTVGKETGLRAARGRFDFVLPTNLRPGPARLTVDLAALQPSPAIDTCKHVHHCYADLPRADTGPRLDLDVQLVR